MMLLLDTLTSTTPKFVTNFFIIIDACEIGIELDTTAAGTSACTMIPVQVPSFGYIYQCGLIVTTKVFILLQRYCSKIMLLRRYLFYKS